MSNRWRFAAVGVLAVLAGSGLWFASRQPAPPQITSAALLAAGFRDLQGQPRSLGEFQGKTLVVNFWATWCAPCREEMPALGRVQSRWGDTVQLVGLSSEEPARVARYAHDAGVKYPLWVGGDEVAEVGRRLGNEAGVLPFTVVLDPSGEVIAVKAGPYTEETLSDILAKVAPKSAQK